MSAPDRHPLVAWLRDRLGFRPRTTDARGPLRVLRASERVFLGRSPGLRDVERLARREGFRALLNLNTEGEPGEVLSPNVEASWAHTFEMQHARAAFTADRPRSEWVDRFLDTLRTVARPVYVHSLGGQRAAALMTIHLALERSLTGPAAVVEAQGLGIVCEPEGLRSFALSEIERRRRPEDPSSGLAAAAEAAPVPRVEPNRRAG